MSLYGTGRAEGIGTVVLMGCLTAVVHCLGAQRDRHIHRVFGERRALHPHAVVKTDDSLGADEFTPHLRPGVALEGVAFKVVGSVRQRGAQAQCGDEVAPVHHRQNPTRRRATIAWRGEPGSK